MKKDFIGGMKNGHQGDSNKLGNRGTEVLDIDKTEEL